MRARLLGIVFLLGCGGSGVDINSNQDNVCDQVAEVACHNLYQCCAEGEIEKFLAVSDPRTEDECRVDVSRRCARSIATLDFGISQKHLKFDAKTMNECLDALIAPSDTCATIESALPWTDACMTSAWIGLVDDGAACLTTAECASKDSFCGAGQTCVALPGDGQPCSTFGCTTGTFCSAGTCRAQVGPGAACTSSIQCVKGLFCDVAAAPAACAPLRAPHEPCTSSAACTSNRCNPGMCSDGSANCFSSNDCVGRCPGTGFICTNDGNCAAGTCMTGGATCFTPTSCGVGNTCIFPVACNHPTCTGDIVCGDAHVTVDYCQGALNDLPVP